MIGRTQMTGLEGVDDAAGRLIEQAEGRLRDALAQKRKAEATISHEQALLRRLRRRVVREHSMREGR